MTARSLIREIEAKNNYHFSSDELVYTEYSIAGANEDDYYEITEYLEVNQLTYYRDRRSMTGIWIIEI